MKKWKLKTWEELSKKELYDILRLREKVFIVEQKCPYMDIDGKDDLSYHLFLYNKDELIAYSRIIPEGISYKNNISFGRVVISENFRGKGIAKEMIILILEKTKELFGKEKIIISAQTYLTKFYSKYGFKVKGEEFLEDSIPHIKMER